MSFFFSQVISTFTLITTGINWQMFFEVKVEKNLESGNSKKILLFFQYYSSLSNISVPDFLEQIEIGYKTKLYLACHFGFSSLMNSAL